MKNPILLNKTQKTYLYSSVKTIKTELFKLNNFKLLMLFLFAIFNSLGSYAQSQNNSSNKTTKSSIRQASGLNFSKSQRKTTVEDFSIINSFSSANRSNVCSPETSLIITEENSYGISRSTLNDSGVPSFCLSLGDESPKVDDVFNTTLTPAADINFNNNTLTNAQIREKVQRTMSIIEHPNFAPSSLSADLNSSFYRAISITVWHYTDKLNTTNYNYSWTANDGNTYSVNNLKQWVNNGTLQTSDVFWLLPVNSNRQPEILLNQNSSSNCCPVQPTITTSVSAPTSSDNGQIILESVSGTQFYGISTLNANNYNGPTTIATATQVPNSLPAIILSNAPQNGGTYIVRVFSNLDGCFKDYTIKTPSSSGCSILKKHQGNCWSTEITSVLANNGKFDIEILVTYTGSNSCKELSHFSIEADNNSFSNLGWSKVSGNVKGKIKNSLGNNDPFDGFKLDDISKIGDGMAGSFKMTYTLNYLQDQQFLAKAGRDYSQIASFTDAEFKQVMDCQTPPCATADNTTSSASITENETKTLLGTPNGGTFTIVSGGGNINGNVYTPDNINTNTTVKIRYTIAADGSCAATSDDITFTVTPVCDIVADNTTSSVSITENETKTLTGTPNGGTFTIVSGGGTINGNVYTPDNINTNTTVKIKYTIAADGSCVATSDDVTFTVTPVCNVVADNTTSSASITESETKTLTGNPNGGTFTIVSGGGTINGNTYTPDNINTDTTVVIKYTIAADGECPATSDDVTFTVTPVCNIVADNTTSSASITESETKTLTGNPNGGTFTIVSGGGNINGNVYTPDNINTNTTVKIRYTIAADGDCASTSDDIKFVVKPVCDVVADNTTSSASITENETKTLTGTPNGGIFTIVSGGGTINGNVYTPDNINTNTTVVIRYTIAADGSCAATSDDVTFTVTPVCNVVADNTTSSATITESETKTLTGNPNGGTFTIVSGGGTINGNVYTPDNINTNTTVKIKYTIAADGSCVATSDDVTFTVTPVCDVVADNTTSSVSITENETKTLTGTPNGGTFTIVSGGGTINGNIYTPDNINTNTTVKIKYTIAADGSCAATSDDIKFTVTPICDVADNTTSTAVITENQTKTLTGNPNGGTFTIVSGGGTINGNVYTPDNINTNTNITIRYSIAADGDCTATSDDVTFMVVTVCDVVADNTTSSASITENETKILTGTPNGGTFTIVSGGGTINGNLYTPADINVDTTVKIKYTIAADGDCPATSDDVTFTVTQVCDVVANNTISDATITENEIKTLSGTPNGGIFTIVSGGGTINGNTYTPADINANTDVTIRYTIAAIGSCAASSDDVTFTVTEETCTQSPTDAALGFNVFTLESLSVKTNETEGSVATGGDLTILGNYQITTNDPGTFKVNNVTVGLVVGGKVNYQTGNSLQINQNTYIKIGDSQGSTVWYQDQNSAFAPIRITKNSNYNSTPRIQLQASANQLNVSSSNNPVFQSNIIDFASAFQTLKANSTSLSQNANNAQLTNPNGQPIANTNLPNQVKINLQNGVNYLNVTGTDLNNVAVFTYNNKPNANRVLVVNVDASGTFNWDVWNQAGVGQQDAPYIIYNFYNTTTLNIVGNSTIEGSLFAPFANVQKSVNQSNIEGQVIAKSFSHEGGEVHAANFLPTIGGCTNNNGVAPTAEFNVNNNECLNGNEFIFNNTSNTGAAVQPGNPITYTWNFGDGTSSTLMNPTKTYANSGTYTVTLIATNSYGSDTTTQQVIVLAAPNNPTLSNTILNSGNGTVTYEFTLTNDTYFDSFSWEIQGTGSGLFANQKVITVDYTTEGVYTIIVTGVKNGCIISKTLTVNITSGEVSGGNSGGVESESLGDAISKIYVGRKKNSVPTTFIKSDANLYNKKKMKSEQPYQGKGQTLLDMFPTQLIAGNVANVTSPTDILDYTIADEVLSVDFSVNGKTKGVVLGIKTSDKIYNHTKASCDRLRGAEILNIETVQLEGYNFLMQGIKQRNGIVEYAISFATAKNNNDSRYTIQTNWYVNNYTKFNDVFNFQVWSTNPTDTQKMVVDILKNLQSYIPVNQTEIQKVPKSYAAKISRDKGELVILMRSTANGLSTEVAMEEKYSETANNVKYRYNPLNTKLEQTLRIAIADGYEYDAIIKVTGEIEDAFYHADGNWGLDFDKKYTKIKEYFVSNDFDRDYQDDEYAINRNVKIKATSDYDYLTVYKSLLPGTISADYSEYEYLAFTAKGSGLMELGLIKSSIEDWKAQYRVMVNLSEEEQTYYVPFNIFSSSATQEKMTAEDLTTLLFTFLPVEANTTELDLEISDVRFTKTAIEEQTINKIEKFENEFMAYPNPSKGNVNLLLFSETDTEATVTLSDITGKIIYRSKANLNAGKNELEFDFRVKAGVMLLQVTSSETDYGTSKIIFR